MTTSGSRGSGGGDSGLEMRPTALYHIVHPQSTDRYPQEDDLNIKQSAQGDVVVLAMSGKIMGGPDHERFMGEIKTLVADGKVDVLLDLSKVTWVNSTGLGILVSGYHTLKKNGGRLKICSVSDRIDNILNVTQLKLVFDTYVTSEEALASFNE
jgi:anti-sigma B factor antagonist